MCLSSQVSIVHHMQSPHQATSNHVPEALRPSVPHMFVSFILVYTTSYLYIRFFTLHLCHILDFLSTLSSPLVPICWALNAPFLTPITLFFFFFLLGGYILSFFFFQLSLILFFFLLLSPGLGPLSMCPKLCHLVPQIPLFFWLNSNYDKDPCTRMLPLSQQEAKSDHDFLEETLSLKGLPPNTCSYFLLHRWIMSPKEGNTLQKYEPKMHIPFHLFLYGYYYYLYLFTQNKAYNYDCRAKINQNKTISMGCMYLSLYIPKRIEGKKLHLALEINPALVKILFRQWQIIQVKSGLRHDGDGLGCVMAWGDISCLGCTYRTHGGGAKFCLHPQFSSPSELHTCLLKEKKRKEKKRKEKKRKEKEK
ncbi:hypothetical protein VP01_136g4 [Puccinia sorghi]|uniref:Uncharacterized protein n=1 Tax=Puccinia sorghi TaxID=27349 RepID=A0A0L6VLQ0_9BASI|nr:hypothetical protein VP01_136g4 [Puccinia sorghi]